LNSIRVLKHPSILTDLGHVGGNGLALNPAPWFRRELELCEEWGFRMKYSANRVSLDSDDDQLVPYWIQKETPAIAWDWLRVHGFFSIPSTNVEAIEMARGGAPGGTLIYTEEQTAGRGRNGRSWFSAAGKGLYFSMLLRPAQPLKYWPLLTHVASTALVEAIKSFFAAESAVGRLDVDLKWPNDVLICGRKCAGILLESVTEGKSQAAVIGIGINVRRESVPESLKSTAACLDEVGDTTVPRRRFLVEYLHKFQECFLVFERGHHLELLEQWKRHSSMWNGAHVWITEGGVRRSAVTCGLDEFGALRVRTPEGNVETVLAGDVSVSRAPAK
jgi:BirA family transcriptional regulator, biotin operon repressor / biotin---[acetyl-CoA-carboxylase] ligase